jgi:hypothetical protein
VIYVSPHDDRVVYQASHVLHRTTDEGVTWETISPDLTAHEAQYQILPGTPITRDITGEEVYSSIYSMVESRLERGVIWVGANDGPVHVSRDNGKTWKNVTPKGLLPGGRVQNIEDSPHRKGSAYIAVYRYLREHDLKPYIYRTDDYGANWTLLTDGTNGLPTDFPTRVVREDPAREGLLYAGTEFAAFVSFNNGRNWQSLQQNLPATPVTDIRVHRNDLVIATMGRSLWIMDNVTPLQQVAALISGSRGPTNQAGIASGPSTLNASALMSAQAARPVQPAQSSVAQLPAVHLFQPRETIRYRHSANAGGNGEPEYPAPGVHIDLWFQAAPPADVKLDVLDAKGQVLRTFGAARAAQGGAGGQEMRGPNRGGGGPSGIRNEAGMQRFTWDMRYPGPWAANAPAGAGAGPMVAPGKYTARLTAGGQTYTRSFDLKADPRVLRDGVTQADLDDQVVFLLKVRDAISDARRLQQSVEEAMKKAGVAGLPAAVPGSTPAQLKPAHPLQGLLAKIVDQSGIYPQPMLLAQFQNVQRMVGQADQKVGRDAVERFNDLLRQLQALQTEFKQMAGA